MSIYNTYQISLGGCEYTPPPPKLHLSYSGSSAPRIYVFDEVLGLNSYLIPSVNLPGSALFCKWHPDNIIFYSHSNSPFITGYRFDPITGYGTKITPTSLVSGASTGVSVNLDGDRVFVNYLNGSRTAAYTFDPVTGFGSYVVPATPVPGNPSTDGNEGRLKINNDCDFLFSTSASPPYIMGWPFDKITGFGSRLDPASTPPSRGKSVEVSSDSSSVLVTSGTTGANGNGLRRYAFDKITGFGGVSAYWPGGTCYSLILNNSNTFLFVAHGVSGWSSSYTFNSVTGAIGSKKSPGSPLEFGNANNNNRVFGVFPHPDTTYIFWGHSTSPANAYYAYTPTGTGTWGTKYNPPLSNYQSRHIDGKMI